MGFLMDSLFEKPFLLSMGPQRAGAGIVYDYLKTRDDICLPAGVKEVCFFDRHFQRGAGFYTNHFPVRAQHDWIAEISTTAFDHPDAPKRVFDLLGKDVTLICPLRDPIARSMAVYEDYLRYGIVTGRIEEAVQQAPQILFASRYADHLGRWFDVFGSDNIQILFYEDAVDDQDAYLKNLCDAMGVTYTPIPPRKRAVWDVLNGVVHHFRPQNLRNMPSIKHRIEARNWLRQRLFPEILKLETLLDCPLPHWKS